MNSKVIPIKNKIDKNFPQKTKIPLVFYSDESNLSVNLGMIHKLFDDVYKIDSVKKLIDLFDKYNYLNFIKTDDIRLINEKNSKYVSMTEFNSWLENLNKEFNYHTSQFEVYTISSANYQKIIAQNDIPGFFVINASGRITIFEENDRQSVLDKIKSDNYDENRIIYNNSHFETLDKFIDFFLRNGKILFLSKKEDYNENEIIYPETEDKIEIDLIDDLRAIIQYSLRSRKANIYLNHSLWAEHFLQKETDGLMVIDEDYYILYVNQKRRQRHKNNILGKKCYQVFFFENEDKDKKRKVCTGCFFQKYHFGGKVVETSSSSLAQPVNIKIKGTDISENQLNQLNDFHELELTDKAGNSYYLTEYNRIVQVNCYQTYLGISACRDTNVRHEIVELTKTLQKETHSDVDPLLTKIVDAFTKKIHFNNVRIYLNYNDTENDEPVLILTASSSSNIKKGDVRIGTKSLEDKSFNRNFINDKNKGKSALDYFNETKDHKRLEIFEKKNLDPNSRIGEKIFEIISEKWIGLPLWNGDHLIGTICLDMGDDQLEKWGFINEGIKNQLLIGSEYLASTLENILTRIRLIKQRKIIDQITKITGSKDIEDLLLISLSKMERNTIIAWYDQISDKKNNFINASKRYVLSSIAYKGEKVSFVPNKVPSTSLYALMVEKNKFKIYSNFDDLDDDEKKLLKYCNKDFKIISKIIVPVYLRDKKTPSNILKLITNVSAGDLTFSHHDKKLYEDVLGGYFSEIYKSHHERTYLLRTIKNTTHEITTTKDIFQSTKKLFAQLHSIFPDTFWFFYQKSDNKLKLISSSENSNKCPAKQKEEYDIFNSSSDPKELIKKGKYSLTVDLFNSDFSDNYKYFRSKEEAIDYLIDKIDTIEGTKYEEEQIEITKFSELVIQTNYKNQKVGLLKIQELKDGAFDFDLINFVLIIAEVIGNIVGLVNEIEAKKEHEASLTHALRSPIVSARWALDVYPEDYLNIDNINDFFKMNEKSSKIGHYPVYWLYALLYRLQSAVNIANFYVDNIDALDFNNFEIEEDVNLRSILLDICYLKKYDAEKDKEGLHLNFKSLSQKEKRKYTIFGDQGKLKIAFFNLLDNAIKYSFMVSGKYRPILIEEEFNSDLLIFKITNYGDPPKENIEKLFDLGVRGSNAINFAVNGTGEGLARCKRIVEYHGGTIKMNCDFNEKKITLKVIFNLTNNLLNLLKYVKKDNNDRR